MKTRLKRLVDNKIVIWGGLGILLLLIIEEPNNSDVVKQILLIAGIFPNIGIGYVYSQ